MKTTTILSPILTLAIASLLASSADAQFSINWFTIDGGGGGGTSAGGVYSVSGTIGQPDAAWPVDQNGFAVPSTDSRHGPRTPIPRQHKGVKAGSS